MNTTDPVKKDTHAIIVAAGRGERTGLKQPKQFELVRGKPMVRHSAESFLSHQGISKTWIVIGSDQEGFLRDSLDGLSDFEILTGGETRQESVLNGLTAIAKYGGCEQVLIHDAARPFLHHDVIDRLLHALKTHKGSIPVLPVVDTIIEKQSEQLGTTLNRDVLRRVQTPQAFDFESLMHAHLIYAGNQDATDDAQLFQAAGHQVALIEGDEKLKKYTTQSDFTDAITPTIVRTGMGFDVHQLAAEEELWLGGIKIEHEKGLVGHSDADVLLHALTDALLGAAGSGDIGDHFPPSDPKWKGAASHQFVKYAAEFITGKGGAINNVDMTLMCEAPKIKPHREAIRQNIADLLEIRLDRVSVKATTTEGLGFTGRREGIAAQAIATISLQGE